MKSSIVGLFLCLSLVSFTAYAESFEAYITEKLETPMYAKIRSKKIIAYLKITQKIKVLSSHSSGWSRIQLKNGRKGWIENKFISLDPGYTHELSVLNKEIVDFRTNLSYRTKEIAFLRAKIKKLQVANTALRKENFIQQIEINKLNEILVEPLKVDKVNHQLKQQIEFLKYDNSILQRGRHNSQQENRSDWQILLIFISIAFLLIAYFVGRRISKIKRESWDL